MAFVGEIVVEGELGRSGPQWKTDRIVTGLGCYCRSGDHDAELARACGQDRTDFSSGRQLHFEGASSVPRDRRAGLVPDLVHIGHVKETAVCAGAENFDTAGDAPHLSRSVKNKYRN